MTKKNPDEFTEKVLAFLGTMGIVNVTKPRFYVDINFDAHKAPWAAYWSNKDTVFRIEIGPKEWSITTSSPEKGSRAVFYANEPSWIASDELGLFARKPRIDQIPALLRKAETKLAVKFPRVAFVRTNIAGAKKAAEAWATTV
jgi:hypothetical protein